MAMVTTDTAPAHVNTHLLSETPLPELDHENKHALQLTAVGTTQSLIPESDPQFLRKNQSAQVSKVRVPSYADNQDIVMDGQMSFNERLNEGKGNFAIADLDKNNMETSFYPKDDCSFRLQLPEQQEENPDQIQQPVKGQK